jgi:hypothetical protein
VLSGDIFTACSHKFILFLLRKTSVIVKTYQLSFREFRNESVRFFVPLNGDLLIFFDKKKSPTSVDYISVK